jgi:hypothetical protein
LLFHCPKCGECSWTLIEALLGQRARSWPESREDDS